MNKLVESYLTRAITERFEESLKEPDKCHKARDEVINASLEEYHQHKGYGVSRETLAKALDSMAAEFEMARAQLRTCETCEGDGVMSAVVDHGPHDEEMLEDVECAECHGTGVSSWGQAIDRAEKAEKDLEKTQAEIATLRGQLAAYGAPDINGASMITNAGLGKDEKRGEK